jgi:mannose-6-phosphate isomerase-like protein (cupin superfamily)
VDFKPVRRVVIGHDQTGKAVALYDGNLQPRQRSAGGNGVTNLWVTSEFPVDVGGAGDRGRTPVAVPPPPHGTVFRIVDFPPAANAAAVSPVDHHSLLAAMGIDPATQGHARHPNTHRTRTIDYAIVLDGEIDMLMDDADIHVKSGDVLIQQGTNHAWVNNSGKNCRIAFVLIDAQSPPAWRQGWKA